MSAKPSIQYDFRRGDGKIALVPVTFDPFIRLMDYLYPTLVSNSTARKGSGYSAFLIDQIEPPVFIGSFTGLCLASVRKNPLFLDNGQWFLRALLAGMEMDITAHDHRSRCAAANYGTLRLWQKLGLGAKLTARGDYVSTTATLESSDVLAHALALAKPGYADLRASAEKRLASLDPDMVKASLPDEKMLASPDTIYDLDVVLS